MDSTKPWIRTTLIAIASISLLGASASAAWSDTPSSESQITAWQLPLAPDTAGQILLLRPYLQPNSDYSAGHRGVDYLAPIDTPVLSPADGQVAFAGRVVSRYLVTIKHQSSVVTELEPVCPLVSVGESVSQGQTIGFVCDDLPGYRWHCDTECLHFSMRIDGKYLSPLALIGGLSPSRLLPYLNRAEFKD